MPEVRISGETITLGQLLKFSGICDSGADAKALLADGQVTVNGETELRRGRKLRAGDAVEALGERVLIS